MKTFIMSVQHLTIVAAAKKSSDLVVVTEERHEKLCTSVLKDESEIAVAAAFEKPVSYFADTETAMHMRLTKVIDQIAEGQKTFHPLVLRQFLQATDDFGVDGKKLTQAAS